MEQPYDAYKNKNVEYDYILEAVVPVDTIHSETLPQIINLLKDEDLLKMYFKNVALGRVYGKVMLKLDQHLYFKFGISLVDADTKITSKELIKEVVEFILSLNKNVSTDNLNLNKGDINVEVITENKTVNDYDKIIVNEGKFCLGKDTDMHMFSMTDDGIIEHYHNEKLEDSFPFAKLTLTRECKSLTQNGYTLTRVVEDLEKDKLKQDVLDNPDKVKQDIQASIDTVDEIQAKQDELNDKLNNLLGEEKEITERFPSNDFSSEPVLYQDLNIETFNEFLTAEQKAYINTYIGTLEEFVNAMQLLYDEVGDGTSPMISIDEYVKEILNDGGISEWTQEMSDLLGYDIKTEGKEFDNIEKEVRKIASEKGLDTSDKAIKTIMKDIIDNFYNGTDLYSNGDINEDKIRNIIIPAMDTYYGVKVGDSLTEDLSYGDLEDLAKDIYEWFDSDMGTHFDEIQGNEEETYGDILRILETKDKSQIQNFIDIIDEADIDNKTAKSIGIKSSEYLIKKLNELISTNIKTEAMSKFYTAENAFDDFLKKAKEEKEDGYYEFKLDELGITKEATAEFKTMLLNRPEIDDIKYDPQTNKYSVKLKSTNTNEQKKEESKKEETQNLSRLYQHTKDKDTFAIIGSQDKDTKQNRSNELKSEISKAQKQFKNVGYNQLEGTYTYENGEQGIEDSYIIYNIPKNTALDIANKLNQESIIWKDSNYFGFINADGSEDYTFKNQDKNMTFDDKITNMFGSKFKNGSNRLAFAFECKLIETTATGSNFSKQGKYKTVKFPVCKIEAKKLGESEDLSKFAEECLKKLQMFVSNNNFTGSDLNENNKAFMQYMEDNNLVVSNVIPNKIFKVYNFNENDSAGGYIGKLVYSPKGIWEIEIAYNELMD